jgi:hypothetical protein
MIKQSNMLGHGLEIYGSSNEVNSNLYLAAPTVIGKVSNDVIKQEIEFATPAGYGLPVTDNSGEGQPNEVRPLGNNYSCGSFSEKAN